MAEPAIRIAGLTKRYGRLTALDALDLTVTEGEFFGLLGPNGAGKTTTINILAGLCVKTAGEAWLHGQHLEREYRTCRGLLGLVPQEFNFDQFIRLRDMLEYQGGFFGMSRADRVARADELLAQFDLTGKAAARVRELSGGMKRRAIIARALMHRPRILILDEPTAGVDVDLRRTLWRFLRELRAEGTTIVLTTHYIEEAEALCDRIAIIREGRIVADDATRKLAARLRTESLVVALQTPAEPAALARLQHLAPDVSSDGCDLRISFDREAVAYGEVLRTLADAGLDIAHLRPGDNRLEQVFLQMTTPAHR